MSRLASIWAQDRRGVLGTGMGMLWHVPADFAHFKRMTLGCPIIMGRRSWEALPGALAGRTNIVLTRTPTVTINGGVRASSITEALEIAQADAARSGAQTIWVTGGAQLYADTMSLVDELVITDLDLDVAERSHPGALVYAPVIDDTLWDVDPTRSDSSWRPASGDARWRVTTYVRR